MQSKSSLDPSSLSGLSNFSFAVIGQPPSLLKRFSNLPLEERELQHPPVSPTPPPQPPTTKKATPTPRNRPSLLEALSSSVPSHSSTSPDPMVHPASKPDPLGGTRLQEALPSSGTIINTVTSASSVPSSISFESPGRSVGAEAVANGSTASPSRPNALPDTVKLNGASAGLCDASSIASDDAMVVDSTSTTIASDQPQPSMSAHPSHPASDLYSFLTELAKERAAWDEIQTYRKRYREEYQELLRRHEESSRATERVKEQADRVVLAAEAALDIVDGFRAKQERRWKAEETRAERAAAAALKLPGDKVSPASRGPLTPHSTGRPNISNTKEDRPIAPEELISQPLSHTESISANQSRNIYSTISEAAAKDSIVNRPAANTPSVPIEASSLQLPTASKAVNDAISLNQTGPKEMSSDSVSPVAISEPEEYEKRLKEFAARRAQVMAEKKRVSDENAARIREQRKLEKAVSGESSPLTMSMTSIPSMPSKAPNAVPAAPSISNLSAMMSVLQSLPGEIAAVDRSNPKPPTTTSLRQTASEAHPVRLNQKTGKPIDTTPKTRLVSAPAVNRTASDAQVAVPHYPVPPVPSSYRSSSPTLNTSITLQSSSKVSSQTKGSAPVVVKKEPSPDIKLSSSYQTRAAAETVVKKFAPPRTQVETVPQSVTSNAGTGSLKGISQPTAMPRGNVHQRDPSRQASTSIPARPQGSAGSSSSKPTGALVSSQTRPDVPKNSGVVEQRSSKSSQQTRKPLRTSPLPLPRRPDDTNVISTVGANVPRARRVSERVPPVGYRSDTNKSVSPDTSKLRSKPVHDHYSPPRESLSPSERSWVPRFRGDHYSPPSPSRSYRDRDPSPPPDVRQKRPREDPWDDADEQAYRRRKISGPSSPQQVRATLPETRGSARNLPQSDHRARIESRPADWAQYDQLHHLDDRDAAFLNQDQNGDGGWGRFYIPVEVNNRIPHSSPYPSNTSYNGEPSSSQSITRSSQPSVDPARAIDSYRHPSSTSRTNIHDGPEVRRLPLTSTSAASSSTIRQEKKRSGGEYTESLAPPPPPKKVAHDTGLLSRMSDYPDSAVAELDSDDAATVPRHRPTGDYPYRKANIPRIHKARTLSSRLNNATLEDRLSK